MLHIKTNRTSFYLAFKLLYCTYDRVGTTLRVTGHRAKNVRVGSGHGSKVQTQFHLCCMYHVVISHCTTDTIIQ